MKQSDGNYNTAHDTNDSGEITTNSKTSYGNCLDDSLAGFTLYQAQNLRTYADRLKVWRSFFHTTFYYVYSLFLYDFI